MKKGKTFLGKYSLLVFECFCIKVSLKVLLGFSARCALQWGQPRLHWGSQDVEYGVQLRYSQCV